MSGITMAAGSIASLTAVAMMLQQAGMDFAGSYSACVLFSAMSTLIASYKGLPVVLTPSLSVTGYLVFIVAISHGLGWQTVLGMSFLSSVLGLLLWQVGGRWSQENLPPVFPWAIKLALAGFLIYLGLKIGRIIITSTWQVTMLGDSANPLMYWSVAGLVLTLSFIAGNWPQALLAGMLLTGGVTFAEGFWVIPAAPFFLPEGLLGAAGQLLLLLDNGMQDSAFYMITVFSLGVMLSAIHWSTVTAFAGQEEAAKKVKMLFAVGAVGAWLGVPPLVVSPTTAAGDRESPTGIFVTVAILVLALFCEPVLAAVADFPAMLVPVLAGSGFLLLLDALKACPLPAEGDERQAAVLTTCILVLLLPLTGNFATALGSALIGYTLFMCMAGKVRQVAKIIWLISGIFVLYYIYGSIF